MTTYYVDPSVSPNPAWLSTTAYGANAIVTPVIDGGADNKYVYKADADGGTSGGSEPAWPTTVGNTVVDNDITWTCMAPDSWEEALSTLQGALDLAVAGDIVYCRGTQTVAATLDVDTNSGSATTGWIRFIGCNSSGNVDGTRFTIQGNGSNACDLMTINNKSMAWFENFRFTAAYGSKDGFTWAGTNTMYGDVFVNCSFDNNTAYGVHLGYENTFTFIRCTFYLNTSGGLLAQTISDFAAFCSFHDNTGDGVSFAGTLYGCVSYDNSDDGIDHNSCGRIVNCTIDINDDDGVFVNASADLRPIYTLIGTRITNHNGSGDIGLNAGSRTGITMCCAYDDNTDHEANDTYAMNISVDGTGTSSNSYKNENGAGGGDTNEGYVSVTDGSEDYSINHTDATTPALSRTAIAIPVT